MTRRTEEDMLQSLVDAAAKVMDAAYADEASANRAIAQMRAVANNIEYRSEEIKKQLSKSIESFADRTASLAAAKLLEKFKQADEQADMAAKRYNTAARLLTLKLVGVAFAVQCAVVGAVYGILVWRVPSFEEAHEAQQQVAVAKDAVNKLVAKGGGAWLTNCDDNGRSRLCIRTDERSKNSWRGEKDGGSYRIIYGY